MGSRSRTWLGLILALLFALAAVGCSSDPDSTPIQDQDIPLKDPATGELEAPPFSEPRPKLAPDEVIDDESSADDGNLGDDDDDDDDDDE